jgi:hypothetical protein
MLECRDYNFIISITHAEVIPIAEQESSFPGWTYFTTRIQGVIRSSQQESSIQWGGGGVIPTSPQVQYPGGGVDTYCS